MTKIPSVEERVEEFMSQYAWGKFFTIELEQEVRENLVQTLTADRLALLQALHDELEGKKQDEYPVDILTGQRVETYGYEVVHNKAIQDQQDNLQALMDKIRVWQQQ